MIPVARRTIWLYAVALLAVLAAGLVLTGCSQATEEAPVTVPPTNTPTPTNTQSIETQLIKNVTPGEASDLIAQNGNNLTVLDVRTSSEFVEGHLKGAVDIDYYQSTFSSDLDKLDKSRAYLVYCRTSRRSTDAVSIMEELGFQEVYNMLGGIERWSQEGRPVVR